MFNIQYWYTRETTVRTSFDTKPKKLSAWFQIKMPSGCSNFQAKKYVQIILELIRKECYCQVCCPLLPMWSWPLKQVLVATRSGTSYYLIHILVDWQKMCHLSGKSITFANPIFSKVCFVSLETGYFTYVLWVNSWKNSF